MQEMNQDYLKSRLTYNPDTGLFIWKRRDLKDFKNERSFKIWNSRYADNIAGTKAACGVCVYIHIRMLGKGYKAHRLAWLYLFGRLPENQIDHINGDGLDNRIANLRDCSGSDNMRNSKLSKRNTSGCVGVGWNSKLNKWHANIGMNGTSIFIGYFKDYEDAVSARKMFEINNGFHKNHGRVVLNTD